MPPTVRRIGSRLSSGKIKSPIGRACELEVRRIRRGAASTDASLVDDQRMISIDYALVCAVEWTGSCP
jgi:hypothetical protein